MMLYPEGSEHHIRMQYVNASGVLENLHKMK